MTANEIIDALRRCINLINNQKAEIEGLNNCRAGLQNERDAYKDIVNEAVDEAKSEAIKEFAERLKRRTDNPGKAMFDVYEYYGETIDNLVKEMTEENENEIL